MAETAINKGVLDSFIFTPAQKAEYYRLLQLGIPDTQARALAQALKKSAKLTGPAIDQLPQPEMSQTAVFEQAVTCAKSVSADRVTEDAALETWRQIAKSGYHSRFVAEAKKALYPHQFADLHSKARSAAGGAASGVARRAAKNPVVQDGVTWLRVLEREIAEVKASIAKSAPTMSEVHVDRPLTGEQPKMAIRIPKLARGVKQVKEEPEPEELGKKRPVKKFETEKAEGKVPPQGVRSACKRGLELAPEYGGQGLTEGAKSRARHMAAGKAVSEANLKRMRSFFARHSSYEKESSPPSPGYVSWQLWGGDAGKRWCESALKAYEKSQVELTNVGTPEVDTLPQGPQTPKLNAQRLIAGMDYHMGNGTDDAAEARTLASRMLASDMGTYDNLFQRDPDVRGLVGLDVDLGSGAHRAPGYLGLDLHAYDYGTAIFDYTDLPLPFDDGEVRSLRMVEAPIPVAQMSQFLKEVQRVLTYGGTFTYAGPERIDVDGNMVPGLTLTATNADDGDLAQDVPVYVETYTRVRARLPWVYGADTNWLHTSEMSVDQLMLNEAMGVPTYTFAEQAMASLLTKSNSYAAEAHVVKAERYQRIVTSVVYAPDELDTDGEWMSAQDIENAAHMFLLTGGYIGSEHGGKPIGADVVESYIAPCDMTFDTAEGEQFVPKGTWIMSVKFHSEAEWQKLLDGEYTGFSVGGFAATN